MVKRLLCFRAETAKLSRLYSALWEKENQPLKMRRFENLNCHQLFLLLGTVWFITEIAKAAPFQNEGLKLNVTRPFFDVKVNTTLYLQCTSKYPVSWKYINPMEAEIGGHTDLEGLDDASQEQKCCKSVIHLDFTYLKTGKYVCYHEKQSSSVYIFVDDGSEVLLPKYGSYTYSDVLSYGKPAIVPCLPVNSGVKMSLFKSKDRIHEKQLHLGKDLQYNPTAGFILNNPTGDSLGRYRCVAEFENRTGSFIMDFDRIPGKPKSAPQVYIDDSDAKSVLTHSNFSLTCFVRGEYSTLFVPPQWEYPVNDSHRVIKSDVKNTNDGKYKIASQKLTILNAQKSDEGLYRCKTMDSYSNTNHADVDIKLQSDVIEARSAESFIQALSLIIIPIVAFASLIMFLVYRKFCKKEKVPDSWADILQHLQEWEISRKKLKIGKRLGGGHYGYVHLAEASRLKNCKETTKVAVKMPKDAGDREQQRALLEELKTLSRLGHHPNIVNLMGCVTKNTPQGILVLVEYCCHGDILKFLQNHKKKNTFIDEIDPYTQQIVSSRKKNVEMNYKSRRSLTPSGSSGIEVENSSYSDDACQSESGLGSSVQESDIEDEYITTSDLLYFALQCAQGMEYLADKQVIHGDLAARNVLLADEKIVKICDFGLAKNTYLNKNYVRKIERCLPVNWMAIESLIENKYSSKSDVWSFGVLLWELCSLGEVPYPTKVISADFWKKAKDYRMEKPKYCPEEVYKIMRDCWLEEPNDRPTFNEIRKSFAELLENTKERNSEKTKNDDIYYSVEIDESNNLDASPKNYVLEKDSVCNSEYSEAHSSGASVMDEFLKRHQLEITADDEVQKSDKSSDQYLTVYESKYLQQNEVLLNICDY